MFPAFRRNKEILEIVDLIKNKENKLRFEISNIQNSCDHDYKNIYDNDEICFLKSNRTLIKKECTECGHTLTKPKGMPWQVCSHCWEKMEENGIIPGHGCRTFLYKCKNGHEYEHT